MRIVNVLKGLMRRDFRYKRLEEENRRYRRIFEGSHNYGFVDWDIEQEFMDWHGGYWRSMGYNREDMEKIASPGTFLEYVHPKDRDKLMDSVRSQLKEKADSEGAMFRIKKKQGGYVWTEIRVDTQRDHSGWVKHVSGVVFDVTVLKQTEMALKESEARHARIIESSNDGIWEWSAAQGGFSFSSRCWEQLGYTEEDIAAIHAENSFPDWRERMHPEDTVYFDKALNDHILKKGPFDIQYRIKGKDGDWRWIRSRGQMTFNEAGEPLVMSGTIMDITKLKHAEKRVIEAKESAEKANKAKSEFLSAMSHELRTPLNAILGFAQLFDLDHNLTEDQRDNVVEIRKAGKHLLKLIGEVLDLAKIEAGRTEFKKENIAPIRIVQSCIGLVKSLADKRNIRLDLNASSFLDSLICVDSTRINQVFINLLTNAIKYNRRSGVVRIYAKVEPCHVTIYVEDTGKGISKTDQANLFQPFNRLGAEKTNVEGSGVGLVITKELVEHMGGELGFSTEINVGTTFWTRFPTCDKDKEETLSEEYFLDDNRVLPALLVESEQRVLYVEDNPSNQRLMSQLLAKFPQFQLEMETQALQGLFKARQDAPDLIILDINLPGMNGYEMVNILKNDPITASIPVIALSANALSHDVERGEEAGFDYYLTKPVDLSQLINVCNKLLT